MTSLEKGFEPKNINPSALPSLPIEWRKGFPDCSAIYFAVLGDKVLYIGRTRSLVKRWVKHHRYLELESLAHVRIAWIEISDAKLLPAIESALISYFKPSLNRTRIKVCSSPSGINDPEKLKRIKLENLTFKFKPLYGDEALAKKSFSVRLPKDLDNYLRSLPNKTEWLREAAIEKWEREQAESDRNQPDS